jgi:uncharacterized membrane protein
VPTTYHRFAGASLERLTALSDGIFAVAMTLLVLNLLSGIPTLHTALGGDSQLLDYLSRPHFGIRLLTYLMSFLTLGIFWNAQQAQFNHFERSDFRLTWIHLAYLLTVTLMPFSTALLATFIASRLAVLVYWLNLLLLGVMLFVSLRYAARAGLEKEGAAEVRSAHQRRIIVYQILYATAVAFCAISTYLAIGLLFALQLTSVVAPRLGRLGRI